MYETEPLFAALKDRGMTQRDLARAIRMNVNTVGDVLHARRDVGVITLGKVATGLGVHMAKLFPSFENQKAHLKALTK